MKRHVIADAGPLIALARLERLDLLKRLFGTVLVTGWVADEVLTGGDFPVELQDLTNPDSQAQCRDLMNLHQIDMGEASAMVLAQHLASQGDAAMLLMDDFRGRSAAQHSGFSLIGTTGLLLLGKQVGAIVAVKPCLLALREHGYFLSDRLIASALEQAGEN
jgi:predicted nucleic acid-binding protein